MKRITLAVFCGFTLVAGPAMAQDVAISASNAFAALTSDTTDRGRKQCPSPSDPVKFSLTPKDRLGRSYTRHFEGKSRQSIVIRRATELQRDSQAKQPATGPVFSPAFDLETSGQRQNLEMSAEFFGCITATGLTIHSGILRAKGEAGNYSFDLDHSLADLAQDYGAGITIAFTTNPFKITATSGKSPLTWKHRRVDVDPNSVKLAVPEEFASFPQLGLLTVATSRFPYAFKARKSGHAPLEGELRLYLDAFVFDAREPPSN